VIRHLAELDVDLGNPQPGDWLYGRAEPGQTFTEYKHANPVKPGKLRRIIYLQPIGKFTPIQDSVIHYTADYLSIFFGLQTKIQAPVSDDSIPSRKHSDGQQQLFTPHILDKMLSPALPDDAVVMMAITAKDLYPGPSWNFVFGQARLKHRVGVSSIFRFSIGEMDPLTYPVCLDRLIKTSSHEIGHMFTIQHCIHGVCVMNGSNSLFETDSRPNRLCSVCLSKLHWNIGFDLQRRSHELATFFKKHKLHLDYELASQDSDIIDNLKKLN
jgi:archaemetzincin